jgi:hypothetical protein
MIDKKAAAKERKEARRTSTALEAKHNGWLRRRRPRAGDSRRVFRVSDARRFLAYGP